MEDLSGRYVVLDRLQISICWSPMLNLILSYSYCLLSVNIVASTIGFGKGMKTH